MSAARIQNAADIACPVKDTDDLDGPGFGPIHNQVGVDGPESERFVSQVLAQMAELRHSGQAAHGVVELRQYSVCGARIIGG